MKLGKEISKASDLTVELILATDDIDEKKKLRKQLKKILNISGKLVEKNIKSDTKKYLQASTAFAEANQKIEQSINDIEKTANTIKKIAKAIDLAAKIAGKVT